MPKLSEPTTKDREPVIRTMDAKDVDDIIDLAFDIPQFDTGTNSQKFFSKSTLSDMIQSEDCVTLVAEKEKKVIGFIITSILNASKDAYIHTLFVHVNNRHRGIGRKLVQRTLEILKQRPDHCNHVFGIVKVENEVAANLLEKEGFEIGTDFKYIDLMLPTH